MFNPRRSSSRRCRDLSSRQSGRRGARVDRRARCLILYQDARLISRLRISARCGGIMPSILAASDRLKEAVQETIDIALKPRAWPPPGYHFKQAGRSIGASGRGNRDGQHGARATAYALQPICTLSPPARRASSPRCRLGAGWRAREMDHPRSNRPRESENRDASSSQDVGQPLCGHWPRRNAALALKIPE